MGPFVKYLREESDPEQRLSDCFPRHSQFFETFVLHYSKRFYLSGCLSEVLKKCQRHNGGPSFFVLYSNGNSSSAPHRLFKSSSRLFERFCKSNPCWYVNS